MNESDAQAGEWIFCPARRNFAGISGIFQKSNAVRAENTPVDCVNAFVQSFLKAGECIIPMLTAVREAMLTEYKRHSKEGRCTYQTDGYTDFVFHTKKMKPLMRCVVNEVINRIIRDANREETVNAQKENRKPILLPRFSCHSLRHTFCTRLCEQDVNIKVIQDVMGHKNITVTLNVYAEATREKKMESFVALDGAIKL